MKTVARRIGRRVWGVFSPLCRPVTRRVSASFASAAGAAIRVELHPQVGEILVGVATARREVGSYRNETNLLLDSLLRELTRLQDEVASLRDEIAATRRDDPEFSLVEESPGHRLAESA